MGQQQQMVAEKANGLGRTVLALTMAVIVALMVSLTLVDPAQAKTRLNESASGNSQYSQHDRDATPPEDHSGKKGALVYHDVKGGDGYTDVFAPSGSRNYQHHINAQK